MPFLSALVVREHPAMEWELERDLVYRGAWQTFTVPQSFTTDFASVPRILWPLFPPYGRHTRAAVLHDWLYMQRRTSRADADGIFRRVMREEGVPAWRRWAMYGAVRALGWTKW